MKNLDFEIVIQKFYTRFKNKDNLLKENYSPMKRPMTFINDKIKK